MKTLFGAVLGSKCSDMRVLSGILRSALFSGYPVFAEKIEAKLIDLSEKNRLSTTERRNFLIQTLTLREMRGDGLIGIHVYCPFFVCRFDARVVETQGELLLLHFPDVFIIKKRICRKVLYLVRRIFRPNESSKLDEAPLLLDLFCQCGAFSSDFIKLESKRRSAMLQNIQSESKHSFCVFRYVDVDAFGIPRAQGSFLKVSERLWLGTDIAREILPGRNLRKGFLRDYMQRFLCEHRPLEKQVSVWFIYVKDHPFWKSFDHYLNTGGRQFSIAKSRTLYIRLSHSDSKRVDSDQVDLGCRVTELSRDETTIMVAGRKENDTENNEVKLLSTYLSVDPNQKSDVFFPKRFFLVEFENAKFLATHTEAPAGLNPNRLTDSIWLFDLSDDFHGARLISSKQLEVISNALKERVDTEQYRAPSLRFVTSCDDFKIDAHTIEMDSRLFSPEALSFFFIRKIL